MQRFLISNWVSYWFVLTWFNVLNWFSRSLIKFYNKSLNITAEANNQCNQKDSNCNGNDGYISVVLVNWVLDNRINIGAHTLARPTVQIGTITVLFATRTNNSFL